MANIQRPNGLPSGGGGMGGGGFGGGNSGGAILKLIGVGVISTVVTVRNCKCSHTETYDKPYETQSSDRYNDYGSDYSRNESKKESEEILKKAGEETTKELLKKWFEKRDSNFLRTQRSFYYPDTFFTLPQ